MITIQAHTQMHSAESSVIRVTTKRCQYVVWVTQRVITVRGPGIEQEYNREGQDLLDDPDLSAEGAAVMAVTHFEESNQ